MCHVFSGKNSAKNYLKLKHNLKKIRQANFFYEFQHKWLIPTLTQKPPKENSVKRFQKGMEEVLEQFETIWLENGKKKYLCGDKISVADIVACCELEQPIMAG